MGTPKSRAPMLKTSYHGNPTGLGVQGYNAKNNPPPPGTPIFSWPPGGDVQEALYELLSVAPGSHGASDEWKHEQHPPSILPQTSVAVAEMGAPKPQTLKPKL